MNNDRKQKRRARRNFECGVSAFSDEFIQTRAGILPDTVYSGGRFFKRLRNCAIIVDRYRRIRGPICRWSVETWPI